MIASLSEAEKTINEKGDTIDEAKEYLVNE